VKSTEKTFISIHFEAKQSKKHGFYFALQRNEKNWKRNETTNFWKRSKVKKRCFNFALVGSEKLEAERSKKHFFATPCETDLVSLCFASFRFEVKIFFCETGITTQVL
jgi:hypothetical protein